MGRATEASFDPGGMDSLGRGCKALDMELAAFAASIDRRICICVISVICELLPAFIGNLPIMLSPISYWIISKGARGSRR